MTRDDGIPPSQRLGIRNRLIAWEVDTRCFDAYSQLEADIGKTTEERLKDQRSMFEEMLKNR